MRITGSLVVRSIRKGQLVVIAKTGRGVEGLDGL